MNKRVLNKYVIDVISAVFLMLNISLLGHEVSSSASIASNESSRIIFNINNSPYDISNLKLIEERGNVYLSYTLDVLSDKDVEITTKDQFMNFLITVSNLVNWEDSQRETARRIFEADLKVAPTALNLRGLGIFGDSETVALINDQLNGETAYAKVIETAKSNIERNRKKRAPSLFSPQRSDIEQKLLMYALAKSDISNREVVLQYVSELSEAELAQLLALAQNDEMGLRPMLISLMTDGISRLAEDSELRWDIIRFTREQIAGSSKYSKRYALRLLEEERRAGRRLEREKQSSREGRASASMKKTEDESLGHGLILSTLGRNKILFGGILSLVIIAISYYLYRRKK